MDEVYANVDYNPKKRIEQRDRGKRTESARLRQTDLFMPYSFFFFFLCLCSKNMYTFTAFKYVSFLLSLFSSQELREEVSWICCSVSGAAQCFPAGRTHWLCSPL